MAVKRAAKGKSLPQNLRVNGPMEIEGCLNPVPRGRVVQKKDGSFRKAPGKSTKNSRTARKNENADIPLHSPRYEVIAALSNTSYEITFG